MKLAILASAACLMASPALANNMCTGSEAGNYNFIGGRLAHTVKAASGADFKVEQSAGSLDNLELLASGKCDVGFVQADALYFWKKEKGAINVDLVAPLYEEYVHLLCNKDAGVRRITSLGASTVVAVGPDGSGSNVTWRVLKSVDQKRYGAVPTSPMSGIRAISKTAEGTDIQCVLFTAGLKTPLINKDADKFASKLALIPTDDGDFDNLRDDKKRPLYSYGEIPGGTYKSLQTGMFTAVKAAKVKALLIAREEWIDKHPKLLDSVINNAAEVLKQPDIVKRLSGD